MKENMNFIAGWIAVAPLITPLLFASLIMVFNRRVRALKYIALIGWLGTFIAATTLLYWVVNYGSISVTMSNWQPPYGISFSIDLLSALFVFSSVPIIGAAMWLGIGNPEGVKPHYYYTTLFALCTGLVGAFSTGDIFNLYVWFEVLLISTLAVMSLAGNKKRFEGLLKYALLNIVATTLFLISVGYLYAKYGTLNFADLASMRNNEVGDMAVIHAIGMLMLLAFLMKAAAFPLMFWLPANYHVPLTSISAVTAALLSKVGGYAIIRTSVLLDAYNLDLLSLIAACTLIFAGIGAISQSEPRRMAGYAVIASTGTVLFGISIGGKLAVAGSIAYALQSMYVLFGLYLITGMAEKITQRNNNEAQPAGNSQHKTTSIFSALPVTASIFLVAGFTMGGLPPLSAFVPKLMLLIEAISESRWFLTSSLLLSSLLLLIAFGRIWTSVFLQDKIRLGDAINSADNQQVLAKFVSNREKIVIISTGFLMVMLGLLPEGWVSLVTLASEQTVNSSTYIQNFSNFK